MTNFRLKCPISPFIMKFYQQVRSVKKSKLAKFRDEIIKVDRVMTSHLIRHDVKIWLCHISINNVGIVLKLCRATYAIVRMTCVKLFKIIGSGSWFTETPLFTNGKWWQMTANTFDVIDTSLRHPTKGMTVKNIDCNTFYLELGKQNISILLCWSNILNCIKGWFLQVFGESICR